MATIAIFSSKQQMSATITEMVNITLSISPSPRILFPTGTTPLGNDGFFANLIQAKKQGVETSRIRLVSGDEYYGVTKEDPGSFATYLKTKVMEPLDISTAHVLDGATTNPSQHCQAFEQSLIQDPCSLAVLGLGTNGHVAFNDPPSTSMSITRRLPLTPGSISASKSDFPNRSESDLPTEALSVGLATLTNNVSTCCVMVTGNRKAEIVAQVLNINQPITEHVPASQLRSASNFIFCLDQEAASQLDATTTVLHCEELTSNEAARLLLSATSKVIVNGDIGGTNARMQMYDVFGSGVTKLRYDKRYQSADFNNGEELIEQFLNDAPLHHVTEKIDALVLAICGPVKNEQVQAGVVLPEQGPTGWGIDMKRILEKEIFRNRIRKAVLINDFVAVGLGVTGISSNDVITLHEASSGTMLKGTKAAVGAGTGLGAVFMTYDETKGYHVAHASEGGMAEFSAQTERQWQLRSFVKESLGGYCTVESIVSGPGLVNVFHFCNASNDIPSLLLDDLDRKDCPARIVQGVHEKNNTCMESLDLWLECLACHLRLTSMQLLPTGGLYICGGIPCRDVVLNRIQELFSPGMFVDDMVMGEYLEKNVSLHVVKNPDIGLMGAKVRAARLLKEE